MACCLGYWDQEWLLLHFFIFTTGVTSRRPNTIQHRNFWGHTRVYLLASLSWSLGKRIWAGSALTFLAQGFRMYQRYTSSIAYKNIPIQGQVKETWPCLVHT